MPLITVSPRRPNLVGGEPILSGGVWTFQIRPARDYVDADGQDVKAIWSEPQPLRGVELQFTLDSLPDGLPYEGLLKGPDGIGGTYSSRSFRLVSTNTVNGTNWAKLPEVPAPGAAPVPATASVQAQLTAMAKRIDDFVAGQIPPNTIKVDDLGQLTEPGKSALKVQGADLAARKLAFRQEIGAGTSSVSVGDQAGQAADGAAFKALQTAVGEKASASSVSALAGRVTSVEQELDGFDLSGVATDQDIAAAVAGRARLDQQGNVITGASGTGLILATQDFVDAQIAQALAQNPSVPDNIQAQLDSKVSKAAMANYQFVVLIGPGGTGPSTRPAVDGPILQIGGPMPLPWIDRSKGDRWDGTPS